MASSLTGETLEKAKKELGEVPEKRGELIQELRERIEEWERGPENEAEGLRFERKDDTFLLRYLRTKKFDINRSLLLYTNYYRYRQKYSHLFTNYTPQAVEHVLKCGLFRVLDHRARNGEKIVMLMPTFWDYETVPFQENYRALMMLLDHLVEDEETQVNGILVINNLDDVSFYAVMKVARSEPMQKGVFIELIQEAFPMRFKGLHLVNQPWYISIVLAIVRPFMKQKLRERLFIHGMDFDSLHQHIDPAGLPEELKGAQPPSDPLSAWHLLLGDSQGQG